MKARYGIVHSTTAGWSDLRTFGPIAAGLLLLEVAGIGTVVVA